MDLWTGVLSCWKCHWPDLKSAGLFRWNLFLNSLKLQHSNPNPNPLANQLWCIDFFTPPTSPIFHTPTPCLPWISYATQKLMLDSCKMLQKQFEAFHTFLWYFFQVYNRILLHIVLLKCLMAFLKFTSCDNQDLVGCIPIPVVAVHLNPKLVCHLIRCLAITYWIFKCPYEKSLETYRLHLVCLYVQYIYIRHIYTHTYTISKVGVYEYNPCWHTYTHRSIITSSLCMHNISVYIFCIHMSIYQMYIYTF